MITEICIACLVATAQPQDTLYISGQISEHNIVVDKPLTLMGDAIIDGQGRGEILTITSDSVVVSGLTFKNVGRSFTEDYAAIRIKESEHVRIDNVHIENPFFGIYIENSDFVSVENSTITATQTLQHESGNAIHAWKSNHLVIHNNTLEGLRDGIYFEFVDHSHISENTSRDNLRYGLHFMFSDKNQYQQNVFSGNGSGVAVMFSKEVVMTHNSFSNNSGAHSYGLLLKEVTDLQIQSNLFEKNTTAINAEGLNRVNYTNNSFIDNGWAVRFRGACYTNVFRNNNFMGNAFDVSYVGNLHDNSFDGNYWSGYTGYDLDRDGEGDVPYLPVSLFSVIVNKVSETMILLRSPLVDLLNFSEKVSPLLTPNNVKDNNPLIKPLTL